MATKYIISQRIKIAYKYAHFLIILELTLCIMTRIHYSVMTQTNTIMDCDNPWLLPCWKVNPYSREKLDPKWVNWLVVEHLAYNHKVLSLKSLLIHSSNNMENCHPWFKSWSVQNDQCNRRAARIRPKKFVLCCKTTHSFSRRESQY